MSVPQVLVVVAVVWCILGVVLLGADLILAALGYPAHRGVPAGVVLVAGALVAFTLAAAVQVVRWVA